MFEKIFHGKKPVIGMVHLKALPGSPGYKDCWKEILEYAVQDACELCAGGIDGLQIENQFDRPYLKERAIGPETTAFLTAAGNAVRQVCPQIPIGINIHLNGAIEAMAAAKACDAQWIRVFNLANSYISNSGYIDAKGPELMRYRKLIDAENIMIFGDFQVKHGSHALTSDRSLEEKAMDIQNSMADAAIITGSATGKSPDLESVCRVRQKLSIPLLIGSGMNQDNVKELWAEVDGAIIGSGFKDNGDLTKRVNRELVKSFMEKIKL